MSVVLFPGQGSQTIGMGKGLFDEFDRYTEIANNILGYSVKDLCLKDEKGSLGSTEYTQPALYVVNALSYYRRLQEGREVPDFLAGHSLGEFNALLAAECFDFETGLRLVMKRGELMSKATKGGMAAILKSSKGEVESILAQNDLSEIDLANFNTPSQIVISGPINKIEQAQGAFFDKGKIFVPLNTSGAFHSRYMESSKAEFLNFLQGFSFKSPKIPVIANLTARPYDEDHIKETLAGQMVGSVRWCESIQYLIDLGEMTFEEVGNGSTLTKMISEIQGVYSPKLNSGTSKLDGSENATKGLSGSSKVPFNGWRQLSIKLSPQEKVDLWNEKYAAGTHVESLFLKVNQLKTKSEAVLLFGHRAAVYVEGYNGYFDLDELDPV